MPVLEFISRNSNGRLTPLNISFCSDYPLKEEYSLVDVKGDLDKDFPKKTLTLRKQSNNVNNDSSADLKSESESWRKLLDSCDYISESDSFIVDIYLIPSTIYKDTVKKYSHSSDALRQFKVVNNQDLYLVRRPHRRNVMHITRLSIDYFVNAQLKLSMDRLRREEYSACLFPLYLLCTLLQYNSASLHYYGFIYSRVVRALNTFHEALKNWRDQMQAHSDIDGISAFQNKLMEMWNSTRNFYFFLPRQMIQCCFLPLLYKYRREVWNSYCLGIEAVLGAISPSMVQLFFISFFTHYLGLCVESLPAKSGIVFSIPKLDNSNDSLILKEVTSAKHFQQPMFSNVVCLLMGVWLQSVKVLSNGDSSALGFYSKEDMHRLVLLNFKYLLGISLSNASTSSLSSLLLHLSLLSQRFDLMSEMLTMLPTNYFSRYFRTIITYVSRMVISCELDSPSQSVMNDKDISEIHSQYSSTDSQSLSGSSATFYLATSVVSSVDSQCSRGLTMSMYEQRKNTVLLLLKRMNELDMNEHGDMELLNSLWKLLNLCYYRDYFIFIKEFLPFVIVHYSKREVLIVVNDINQFMKKVGNHAAHQQDLIDIVSILTADVEDISEYLQNDVFMELVDCINGESRIHVSIHIVTSVLDSLLRIDNRSLIDNLLSICISGFNSYNQLMPESCYLQLQQCLLRFVSHVSFGDNFLSAFEFFNSCLLNFGSDSMIAVSILKQLLVVFSNILLPYCPRKSNTLIASQEMTSTVSGSTFSAQTARIIEKTQQQRTADGLSVQHYQIILKILTVITVHSSSLNQLDQRLNIMLQAIDLSFYAGSLTQAYNLISDFMGICGRMNPQESFRLLSSLLGVISRHTCIPYDLNALGITDVELDPFGVIKSVQSIAAKHISIAISKKANVPVSDYYLLCNCVVALYVLTRKKKSQSVGLQSNYHYFDFDGIDGKEMICDVVMTSNDTIYNSLKSHLKIGLDEEQCAQIEEFVLFMLDVYSSIFVRNEVLRATVNNYVQLLQDIRLIRPFDTYQLAFYQRLTKELYQAPQIGL